MNELLILSPPPEHPVATGTSEEWRQLEHELNIRFPENYILFINTYGNGRFNDFFGFPSPFYHSDRGSSFEKFVQQRTEGVRFAQQNMPNHAATFRVFPTEGGLFPIGYTDNGGTIFWLTEGLSSSWPLVCMRSGYTRDFEKFDLSLTLFIENWLEGRLEVRSLTPADFFPLRSPVFCPSRA